MPNGDIFVVIGEVPFFSGRLVAILEIFSILKGLNIFKSIFREKNHGEINISLV